MKPGLGQSNLGAVVGAVVGATGGLFAVGIARAILSHKLAFLIETPMVGLLCMLVSGPIGWLLGGQIGPRLGEKHDTQRAEIIGGVLGGLVPVVLLALLAWYLWPGTQVVTPH
jgi:hypothetical protein